MKNRKKPDKVKNEKPEENRTFGLDIDFEEALERFLGVNPQEVAKEDYSKE